MVTRRQTPDARRQTWPSLVPTLFLLSAFAWPLAAEDLLQSTLPQRSALHEDPTLEAPLGQLVEAFRRVDRAPDLVGVYRGHLGQFPQDRSATVVLVRLLMALRDPGAAAAARQAVQTFPDHAYLRWLLFQALTEAGDRQAVDELAKAVELETVAWRRAQWTERLVAEAVKTGRRDLAERHLAGAAAAETGAAGKLAVARRQIEAGLHEAALATLDAAAAADPAPEVGIDIQAEAATVEALLQRREAAARRLDAVLARLGPEHWRRAELTRRRLELAGGEADRNALIEAARARHAAAPDDETAVLDHARLLMAADRRRDALAVLARAGAGARVEQELLALHARLHDPQALDAWLAERLAADPARHDLALRRVRTLIELGKADEARALRERTAAALPADGRGDRLLALARDLRRDGRHADAAQVLEGLVAAAPGRVDLVRELAEAWLAAGDRGRAEELLGRDLPADTAPEQVLEAVQLMVRERQYRAAGRAIAARLAADPGFFELRVQAIRLAARCGDAAGAERAVDEARALTDTPARYRLWLDAAVEAVGGERDAVWLDAERQRLIKEGGGWSPARGDRLLAFAETCATRDRAAPAADLLAATLADTALPATARPALRRRLVALRERLPDAAERLLEELKMLAAEDPALADECRARTALHRVDVDGQRGFDASAVSQALAGIDVTRIGDAALVARMHKVFTTAGDQERALRCQHRLTILEPATALHWEQWMEGLAQARDEEALRGAVRRLLSGIENLELDAPVRANLAKRLADSCWRSASARAAAGDWAGMLGLIDQAETVTVGAVSRRWMGLARALALHHLERREARDQALDELERLLRQPVAPVAGRKEGDEAADLEGDRVVFPDGLVASLPAVRAWFALPPSPPAAAATRAAPLPPWRVAWSAAFTAPVAGVWLAQDRVVVACADGQVVGMARDDGRRLWDLHGRSASAAPTTMAGGNPWDGPQAVQAPASPSLPAVVGGVVVGATHAGIEAHATADGRLRWSSTLVAAQRVVACAGLVVAWDDQAGLAAGFDSDTGRLRWRTQVPALDRQPQPQAPGLVADDATVLVLGRHAAVLDARTGLMRWGFTTTGVEPHKPTLTKPAATGVPLLAGMGAYHQQMAFHRGGYGRMAMHYNPYQQQEEGGADDPWLHVLVGRIRSGNATAALVAGHLVVGDGGTVLAAPLAVPLRSCPPPVGMVVGASGRRLAILAGTMVSVVDLVRNGEVVASIDCAPHCAVTPPDAAGGDAPPPWISGVSDGRLVWLAGPTGVVAIDLERGAIAMQAPWPAGIAAVAGEGPRAWSPGAAFLGTTGGGGMSVGVTGAVGPGLLVLPAGTRRLVALTDAADAGADYGR